MCRPEIITAQSATPPSPPQMPDVSCGHVVALISPTLPATTGQQIILPGNCEIGDVVEAYSTGSTEACTILPPGGDSFVGGNEPSIPGSSNRGFIIRKVSATEWVWVG